jgi:hypothetical protein
MPFALVNTVCIENIDRAREALQRDVIADIKNAPGFIRAFWTDDRASGHGISFILFEHRDEAESMMNMQQSSAMKLPHGVSLKAARVYEVHGEA